MGSQSQDREQLSSRSKGETFYLNKTDILFNGEAYRIDSPVRIQTASSNRSPHMWSLAKRPQPSEKTKQIMVNS